MAEPAQPSAAPSAPPTPAELSARIKQAAGALGFDLCGIAEARRLEGAFLARWIAEGHSAGLGYMRQRLDERLDPGRLLPGARSVIALAMNYHREALPPVEGQLAVARYARGRDYHLQLRRGVRKLRRRLLAWAPGARAHPSVDTSPVLEKVWAQLAGLGWVGRNGLLITQSFGSWVVLATLITDLELSYDPPHAERCGACRACLPSCPTDALLGDGQVDARRCLAAWTIEVHGAPSASAGHAGAEVPGFPAGAIPPSLRKAASAHQFGCDACQEACPWNRFAQPSARPELVPLPLVQLRSSELLRLPDSELRTLLIGSALQRPGLVGLRRNALLGLLREPGIAPEICARYLDDPSPVLREAARWVLAELGGEPEAVGSAQRTASR